MAKISVDRSPNFIAQSAVLLHAMSNATRIEILTLLACEEIKVRALAEKVGLSQSALSQHLAILRAAGVVETRREAQMIYYSCSSAAVLKVLETLLVIYQGCSKLRQQPRAKTC